MSANIFADLKIELAIGKTLGSYFAELTREIPADLLSQRRVGIAAKDLNLSSDAHSALVQSSRFKVQRCCSDQFDLEA